MEHNGQCSLSCEMPGDGLYSATCLVNTLKSRVDQFYIIILVRVKLAINRRLDHVPTN